ncbi:hypothetical protein HQ563_00785 [bacterium]|nr:hypothetical protein [bacterium]
MANYSSDEDLLAYEPDILNHLPETTPPTTSFDTQHAESKRIIDEIILTRLPQSLRQKIKDGDKSMNDAVDEADLKTVSVLHTFFLIFNWLSMNKGDIFDIKSVKYRRLFEEKLSSLSFDISTDSDAEDFEEEVETGGVKIFRA